MSGTTAGAMLEVAKNRLDLRRPLIVLIFFDNAEAAFIRGV
jgi:hypothetical protein